MMADYIFLSMLAYGCSLTRVQENYHFLPNILALDLFVSRFFKLIFSILSDLISLTCIIFTLFEFDLIKDSSVLINSEFFSAMALKKFCVPMAITAVVFACYYYFSSGNLKGTFNIVQLKYDLHTKIFGQTKALNAIINNLAMGPHYNHAGVVFLIGGTGVGKTLALSLIRENYQPSEMIINLQQQDLSSASSRDNAMEQVKKLTRVNGEGLVTIDNSDVISTEL
jgi:ABC-type siderophore export system fused ATPase/permease subunit